VQERVVKKQAFGERKSEKSERQGERDDCLEELERERFSARMREKAFDRENLCERENDNSKKSNLN
jgi:hypothetical protein